MLLSWILWLAVTIVGGILFALSEKSSKHPCIEIAGWSLPIILSGFGVFMCDILFPYHNDELGLLGFVSLTIMLFFVVDFFFRKWVLEKKQ